MGAPRCPFLAGVALPAGEGRPLALHVTLTPSDEVQSLRAEVERLQAELSGLRAEYNRLEFRFRCEAAINLELTDLCREHGVPVREAMSKVKDMSFSL